jgi:Arc/MetJ-type ribon-helix-helix transcriptional regulator
MVKRYSDADEAMRAAREAMNEKRREVLKWSQGSEEDQLDLCNTCAIRELIDKLRSAQQG